MNRSSRPLRFKQRGNAIHFATRPVHCRPARPATPARRRPLAVDEVGDGLCVAWPLVRAGRAASVRELIDARQAAYVDLHGVGGAVDPGTPCGLEEEARSVDSVVEDSPVDAESAAVSSFFAPPFGYFGRGGSNALVEVVLEDVEPLPEPLDDRPACSLRPSAIVAQRPAQVFADAVEQDSRQLGFFHVARPVSSTRKCESTAMPSAISTRAESDRERMTSRSVKPAAEMMNDE